MAKTKTKPKPATAPVKASSRNEAIALDLLKGMTTREAGRKYGLSHTRCAEIMRKDLAVRAKLLRLPVEVERRAALDRLDRLDRLLWAQAELGSIKAMTQLARNIRLRAEIAGIPAEVKVSGAVAHV